MNMHKRSEIGKAKGATLRGYVAQMVFRDLSRRSFLSEDGTDASFIPASRGDEMSVSVCVSLWQLTISH
ncbi:hypothetical protein ACFL1Z_03890 [Thermodesulfobacteriota bacterium]